MTSLTFFYFGFGSNLLKQRLKLQNRTAIFKTIAKLQDHKLCFDNDQCKRDTAWRGSPATIECHPGHVVWGVVWELSKEDMPNLDMQEGVAEGIYKPIEVSVTTPSGEILNCRSYKLLMTGAEDKRPSPQYVDVIIRGAQQSGLPADYIEGLKQIEHNGYAGTVPLYEEVLKSLDENA